MNYTWVKQPDGTHSLEHSGFKLQVVHRCFEDDPGDPRSGWHWTVTAPDGSSQSYTEDTLEEAQAEACRAARRAAIRLANRLLGTVTAQEQVLRGKAFGFLGDGITWEAYLGDQLLGSGPTREAAIEAGVREYQDAIGFGDAPRIASREDLVAQLNLCLAEEEEE